MCACLNNCPSCLLIQNALELFYICRCIRLLVKVSQRDVQMTVWFAAKRGELTSKADIPQCLGAGYFTNLAAELEQRDTFFYVKSNAAYCVF